MSLEDARRAFTENLRVKLLAGAADCVILACPGWVGLTLVGHTGTLASQTTAINDPSITLIAHGQPDTDPIHDAQTTRNFNPGDPAARP
jgi:hypothetical protein